MRGKLINSQLVYAPYEITINNVTYSPATDAVLEANGWKVVVSTDMPADAPKYKHYESSYQDGEVITQIWTLVDDSPASICAQLRAWFDNSYRYYNEKLTRFAALQIEEIIDDEFRGVSYSNLMDLYREAEAVRAEIHALENSEVVTNE